MKFKSSIFNGQEIHIFQILVHLNTYLSLGVYDLYSEVQQITEARKKQKTKQ